MKMTKIKKFDKKFSQIIKNLQKAKKNKIAGNEFTDDFFH